MISCQYAIILYLDCKKQYLRMLVIGGIAEPALNCFSLKLKWLLSIFFPQWLLLDVAETMCDFFHRQPI